MMATGHYGYVLDDEWRATRQEVEVTETGVLVNGQAPRAVPAGSR
jgi:hypothetical protein